MKNYVDQKGYKFLKGAVWACRLRHKAGLETARVIGSILTCGLGEISRATAGDFDHWYFVAYGKNPRGEIVYFIASFGQGSVMPTRNGLLGVQIPAQEFQA